MMIFDVFMEKWNGIKACDGNNAMMRVDDAHPLDFFMGLDSIGRCQLMLISSFEPHNMIKSRAIDVAVGKRHDERWAICFILIESGVKPEFIRLCWDLVESSRTLGTTQDDINFVLVRFTKWQRLMEQGRDGILSAAIMKGLLGELIFLEQFAFKKYGIEVAVRGWMGPEQGDRDFVYNDTWYEIKSVDPSAKEVSISSIEQLDVESAGRLIVYFLEKTSLHEENAISLMAQVNMIRKKLNEHSVTMHLFETKLFNIGYLDCKEYDEQSYICRNKRCFDVNSSFPRLRKSGIAAEIQRASYALSLSGITRWEL